MKLLLWSSILAHVTARQNPITRVVELLNGLAEKVEYDMKKSEDLYEDFVCWGKTVITVKTEANEKAASRIDHLEHYIEDLEAGRVELTTERVDLEKELAGLHSDIETAEALRKKENEDYEAAKSEMSKAIKALEDAIEVLKEATKDHKEGSLLALRGTLNGGFADRAAEADALAHAVGVGKQFLSEGDAFFLQKVLEGDVSDPKNQRKLNRKATFKMSYKARSLKIQGVLQKLLSSFKESLKDADDKEEKAVKEHKSLMKSKDSLKEKAQNALTTMDVEGGAAGLSKTDAEDEVSDLKEQIKNDKKFISETEQALDDKKEEWKTRKELMVGEVAAINKAISILHSDDARDLFKKSFASHSASFLQLRVSHVAKNRQASASDAIMRAANHVGDLRLMAIATRLTLVSNGHFDKVIAKIDAMIKQLEGESDDDKKAKTECEDNRKQDITDARDTSHAIDDLSDKITKLEEEIKQKKEEIEDNLKEIKKIKDELADATKIREEEHEEWKENDADDKSASELVASAKKVLAKFYEDNNLNLLQHLAGREPPKVEAGEAPPPPPATWEEPYSGASESKGIVSILGSIKDDIDKDRADAEKAEKEAAGKFDTFKSDSESQIGTLEDSNVNLETAVGQKEDEITSSKTDIGTKKKELEATVKKLKDAQEGCDFITVHFELREENRKIEIEGLTKAKEILEKER